MSDGVDSKISYLKKAADIPTLSKLVRNGDSLVLVGGCFDVIHFGHVKFLKAARALGDLVVVLLESDESLEDKKKRKKIHTQAQRAAMLSALSMVDYVIALPSGLTDEDYEALTRTLKPAVIAITQGDPLSAEKERQAKLVGGVVTVAIPEVENLSTSSITTHAANTGS